MNVFFLFVMGASLGSFIDALTWRLGEEMNNRKRKTTKSAKSALKNFMQGRSVCDHCRHQLAVVDLIPLFSWVGLRGRCRYCGHSVTWMHPLIELTAGLLFAVSYLCWPVSLAGSAELARFVVWLVLLVGFVGLSVFDLRWQLLPNKLVYPLLGLVLGLQIYLSVFDGGANLVRETVLGMAVAGGIFYLLFQMSKGRWIGGGDVKLGFTIGAFVGGPFQAMLVLFIASLLGVVVSLPLMAGKKLGRKAQIPFGPFLMAATVIIVLFGGRIEDWYNGLFLIS